MANQQQGQQQGQPGQAGLQGGTQAATGPPAIETMQPAEFAALQNDLRQHAAFNKQAPILGVMLAGRTGWTPQQVGVFLGCETQVVERWIGTYKEGGLPALRTKYC